MRRVPTARLCTASAAVTVALLFGGCGNYEDDTMVRDYCEYGSRSEAQFEGCQDHVTADQVRKRNTPAARWAKDGGYCGPSAGPFCFDREQAELDDFCGGQPDDVGAMSPEECGRKYQTLSNRRAAAGWGHIQGY